MSHLAKPKLSLNQNFLAFPNPGQQELVLWDAKANKKINLIKAPSKNQTFTSLCFSRISDSLLVAGTSSGQICMINMVSAEITEQLRSLFF